MGVGKQREEGGVEIGEGGVAISNKIFKGSLRN